MSRVVHGCVGFLLHYVTNFWTGRDVTRRRFGKRRGRPPPNLTGAGWGGLCGTARTSPCHRQIGKTAPPWLLTPVRQAGVVTRGLSNDRFCLYIVLRSLTCSPLALCSRNPSPTLNAPWAVQPVVPQTHNMLQKKSPMSVAKVYNGNIKLTSPMHMPTAANSVSPVTIPCAFEA